MPFEDFKGFWKVEVPGSKECAENSIVTFDQTGTDQDPIRPVTILCCGTNLNRFPYGEGTASYNSTLNTIEVPFEGKIYAIKIISGNPPKIMFGPKELGPLAGSWTAEDYVPPGSKSEPAGE